MNRCTICGSALELRGLVSVHVSAPAIIGDVLRADDDDELERITLGLDGARAARG